MTNKLPALQFYPGDWKKDIGVQSLDYFTRGIWFEILLLLHDSEDRGKLSLNGQPMPMEALARILGLDQDTTTEATSKILASGVASVEQGFIVCRRMIRDENKRRSYKNNARLGGLATQAKAKQKSTSSSSSSFSTAVKKIKDSPLLAPPQKSNGEKTQPQVRIKRAQPDTPWQRMVDHIWMDWQKRKGVPYTTTGSEFRDLKHLAEIHQPEGVMALWDLHVRRLWYPDRAGSDTDRKKSEYWKARGHDVVTFCQNVNFLVDDPAWKPDREKFLRLNADLAKPADLAAGEEAVSPEEINNLVHTLVHKEST